MSNGNYNRNTDPRYEELVKNRSKKKSKRVRKFFAIVVSIILIFILLSAGIFAMYIKFAMDGENNSMIGNMIAGMVEPVLDMVDSNQNRNRMTALVLGVDEDGTRTDVIFVATMNKKTNQIDVISIPRDTRIELSKEDIADIKKTNAYIPQDGKMKINEIHAYSFRSKPVERLKNFIENKFSIKIDYYVKVDIKAFREIVDAVGGIRFNVPDYLYYYDPTANFLINLKPGDQLLDGKKAEQLVRFRGYAQGDIKRIEIQQAFLKEAYRQIVENMTVDKLPNLAVKLYDYVQTDFGIAGIPEAVKLVKKVSSDNINMYTLPGSTGYVGDISYYFLDEAESQNIFDLIWNPEKSQISGEDRVKWEEY